ncbi:MAG: SIS domain-containing protein [Chloroflexales bacterium]|nr:SIS domain-containing protein [Chloroflexales bacterium]
MTLPIKMVKSIIINQYQSKRSLMDNHGLHTFNEIMSQPSVWQATLEELSPQLDPLAQLWAEEQFEQVIFTGCGSPYYLALTGAALFQSLTKIPSQAYPASEIVLFPDMVFTPYKKILLIAISRSGETTETIEAVEEFQRRGYSHVLSITCHADTRLTRTTQHALVARHAHEHSIAQTRSFSSMAVLVLALAELVSRANTDLTPLVPAVDQLLTTYQGLARHYGEATHIERFFFLGSGPQHGIAREAMLKMKEMSLAYSEAYHTLEFRHGPMSMVNEHTLVIGLVSEEAAQQELAVLADMRRHGAHTLTIVDQLTEDADEPPNQTIVLNSQLPAWARVILYLPVLQLLSYYKAMASGLDPDRPTNLDAVVLLKSLRS